MVNLHDYFVKIEACDTLTALASPEVNKVEMLLYSSTFYRLDAEIGASPALSSSTKRFLRVWLHFTKTGWLASLVVGCRRQKHIDVDQLSAH